MNAGELERLRPTEGARFLLELDRSEAGGARAHYHAWVLTPDGVFAYGAVLGDGGDVTVTAVDGGAPAELVATLEMIARLTARSASKKKEDGLPPWPHRVLRWRGAGRGG
jgi:hypothetical protein